MPTQQGVERMLKRHQDEGKTFLSMDAILDYLSPVGQRKDIHDDPELMSALEEVDLFLYNLGCQPTEGGYSLPPRETAH
ncbi:hypothetical protein KY331_01490 [Candidatus Woesearchaeota archaeon]|nr:hypothetical protein [Candidatus Woesearchaeota archaeon]